LSDKDTEGFKKLMPTVQKLTELNEATLLLEQRFSREGTGIY